MATAEREMTMDFALGGQQHTYTVFLQALRGEIGGRSVPQACHGVRGLKPGNRGNLRLLERGLRPVQRVRLKGHLKRRKDGVRRG